MKPLCIIVAGPTAVGKTQLAVDLACHFNTEIISCDSRQCFRELNIGVAKPDAIQLQKVHHHFINSHSIHDKVSAADFEKIAVDAAQSIFKKNKVAVMAGGTGLYIKAFEKGLDPIPPVSEDLRDTIVDAYSKNGIDWLSQVLIDEDPEFASSGEMQNPQRMMRALEVKRSTGKSILAFQNHIKKTRPFDVIKIGLELPREVLYDRINQRVDMMMEEGLLEEVRSLFAHRDLNALQTVGYTELFSHLEGECELSQAIMLIKQHTRNYAKRQMTWFKKDFEYQWFTPDIQSVISFLEDKII